MSNVQLLEIFKESGDAISVKPAAKKRMKKRHKIRLLKLSTLENLFRIDMEKSKLKLHYRDYSLDASDFTLFPIISQWLISQRPEDRRNRMYWPGNLGSIAKVVGITPKQFILCHIDFCRQNLTDLQEVKKRVESEWRESGKQSEETDSTQSAVISETRPGETNNSESNLLLE